MRSLLSLAVTLLAFSSALHAQEDNPYKKAKIGDWIEWTSSMKAGGFAIDGGMKQTLIAKSDTEVTLEVINKLPGGGEQKQEMKIKLDEKYDAVKVGAPPGTEVKEIDKGSETITVNGKQIKAQWRTYEMTTTSGGQKISMKGKSWVSADVPLGGLVRSENDVTGIGKQTLELKDHGSK